MSAEIRAHVSGSSGSFVSARIRLIAACGCRCSVEQLQPIDLDEQMAFIPRREGLADLD
jgi:hypothetical protein